MKKILNYITENDQGVRLWAVVFGSIGTITAIITGFIAYSSTQNIVQNFFPIISVPIGFLCVYFLGMRKNIGNILGFIANLFELCVNIAFNNFGFAISTIYFGCTHVLGFFDWKKNIDEQKNTKIKKLAHSRDFIILLIVLVLSTIIFLLSQYIQYLINPKIEFLSWFFWANILAMYLGIVAQGAMILRYRYSWWIWFGLNLIAIPTQFFSGNIVYGVMYCFYQLNVILSLYAQYNVSEQSIQESQER